MINKNRMIFFNTAYMNKYQGNYIVDDVPINGGEYIKLNKWGGEVFNFKPFEGIMYGYVEPGVVLKGGRQRDINISRLARPGEMKIDERILGILVVWVARPPKSDQSVMVGWYENATVYRKPQHFLEDASRILPNGSYDYFASAIESDCQLIPVGKETVGIPRGVGALGRSSIWYADSPLGDEIKDKVVEYINKWKLMKNLNSKPSVTKLKE
jgi:hypothetical protein